MEIKLSVTIELPSRDKYSPAVQTINMCKEAYTYMTSKECPEWSKPHDWNRLSKKEKLNAHIKRICEDLKGTKYTFIVMDN